MDVLIFNVFCIRLNDASNPTYPGSELNLLRRLQYNVDDAHSSSSDPTDSATAGRSLGLSIRVVDESEQNLPDERDTNTIARLSAGVSGSSCCSNISGSISR